MAEKRMFTKKITETDVFLAMPLSTQCLYFHLNLNADDEGFVSSPKKVMRIIGAREDDMKVLVAKRYVMPFESGVCVIKHWKMHNAIRKDRSKPTNYIEEKSTLKEKDNGVYTEKDVGCRLVANCQPSIEESSIVKVSIEESSIDENSSLYVEIVEHLNKVCGTTYKPSTKKTQSLINARVKDGYNLDDFKLVIDFKAFKWLNDEHYRQYLRPSTLFGTNFESYKQNAKVEMSKQEEEIKTYKPWSEL